MGPKKECDDLILKNLGKEVKKCTRRLIVFFVVNKVNKRDDLISIMLYFSAEFRALQSKKNKFSM